MGSMGATLELPLGMFYFIFGVFLGELPSTNHEPSCKRERGGLQIRERMRIFLFSSFLVLSYLATLPPGRVFPSTETTERPRSLSSGSFLSHLLSIIAGVSTPFLSTHFIRLSSQKGVLIINSHRRDTAVV